MHDNLYTNQRNLAQKVQKKNVGRFGVIRSYKNFIFHLYYGNKSNKYLFFAFGPGTKTARNRRKKFQKSLFWILLRVQDLIFEPEKFYVQTK